MLTSNVSPVALLCQNKVMFLPTIMLQSNLPTNGHFLLAPGCPLWRGSRVIYDEPPLKRDQPPISGHLPVPRGWPLNRGSTHCLRFPGIIRACSKLFYKENSLNAKKRTSYTAYLRLFVLNRNYREIFVKLYRLISLNSKTKYDYNYVRIDVFNTFLTICFFLL